MTESEAAPEHLRSNSADSRAWKTLVVIDLGGTKTKIYWPGTSRNSPSKWSDLTTHPATISSVASRVGSLPFDSTPRICVIGFPGLVRNGQALEAPPLTRGLDLCEEKALLDAWSFPQIQQRLAVELGVRDLEVKFLNDADLHALGAIRGSGVEFVMTLGTAVGTSLAVDGALLPHLEFAHTQLDGAKAWINDLLGDASLRAVGREVWCDHVLKATKQFFQITHFDQLIVGGGNAIICHDLLHDYWGSKYRMTNTEDPWLGALQLLPEGT